MKLAIAPIAHVCNIKEHKDGKRGATTLPAALTTQAPRRPKMANRNSTTSPRSARSVFAFLRRILPPTFRANSTQVEISNPVSAPAWVPQGPWLVDRTGSVFVRLA